MVKKQLKRANGEGSLTYNETRSRFEYKITYVDPLTGNSKRKLFTSPKSGAAAKRKATAFLEDLKTKSTETDFTLASWIDYWYECYKKNSVGIKTQERYTGLIDCNIKPYEIGNVPIGALTSLMIQSHLNELSRTGGSEKKGLAARSINATRMLIIAALKAAVNADMIPKNFAEATTPMRIPRADIHVLTKEEGRKLIAAALKRSRPAWITIVLALGTGMRIAEIFGLEWQNIDLDAGTVRVDKTVITTSKGIVIQNATKTKSSRRTIPIPSWVIDALRRYRLWQKVQDTRYGYPYMKASWVLSNPEGNPRSPNSFSAHMYKDILRNAGISTKVRIHDLRHTHATWLLEAGTNVKVVSERLGHSTCRVTLDTYAHVMPTMQTQAVTALETII